MSRAESFGGFALGTLQLALPMSALREVVECVDLIDLPCPAASVIGGIALRGVVVPVVDLRRVLGREARVEGGRHVVIMLHGGRILGLLADAVTGIFEAVEGSFQRTVVDDPVAAILLGGVQRDDNGQMVSVLSAEALSRLHQVPMVDDPEPARQRVEVIPAAEQALDRSVPMMLLQCNRVPLAIEAMLVHATLADPTITVSALTSGHCRGVIDYDAAQVPAVDLLALCGLGVLDTEAGVQAFMVSFPAGFVAFLVSGVVDVVRTEPGDVTTVPAFALPRPELFAGALPLSTPSMRHARPAAGDISQYFVLSTEGLTTCEEVRSLANLNVTAADAVQAKATGGLVGTEGGRTGRRSLITYLLDTERATLIDQVTEILPYPPGIEILRTSGSLLGFLVNRGRSIPVMCLSRLCGRPAPAPTASASVLVVESGAELIGFAVPSLKSIEQTDWESALPDFQNGGSSGEVTRGVEPRKLALVGHGERERMLPVIDLLAMADTLQRGAASVGARLAHAERL